jgi:NADH-quinone oxidoreductase subunit G
VISQGHYVGVEKPKETFSAVHGGRQPKLLMDIHSISEVNMSGIDLSAIPGPAHSDDFESNGKALNQPKP